MKNKKYKTKTIKQFLKESGNSVDDLLKIRLVEVPDIKQENNNCDVNVMLSEFTNILNVIYRTISKIIKHENILGAMSNFLLSRYHDLANLHRADLNLDDIEADKDEMQKVFDENK